MRTVVRQPAKEVQKDEARPQGPGTEAARRETASRRRAESVALGGQIADRLTDGRYSQANPKFARLKDDRRVNGPVRVLTAEEQAAAWAERGMHPKYLKSHAVEVAAARPKRWVARCTCGWSFGPSKLTATDAARDAHLSSA